MKWYKLTGEKFGKLTVIGVGKILKVKNGTRKYWKCKCECGQEIEVISAALVKGKTKSCGCLRKTFAINRSRELSPKWKGGKHTDVDGYVKILVNGKYRREHSVEMEKKLGRKLIKNENVHHINGIKNDNRIENLELWSTSHPCGQRIKEKINWCIEFLSFYAPEKLK